MPDQLLVASSETAVRNATFEVVAVATRSERHQTRTQVKEGKTK